MTHHLNLNDWHRWLQDARDRGMWEEHPSLPGWYVRDPDDELAGEARPVPVEKREAA